VSALAAVVLAGVAAVDEAGQAVAAPRMARSRLTVVMRS
jgi:hypothetical protein